MRGKGEGSVYKRKSDGMWVGSIELNSRPGNLRPRKVVYAKRKADLLEKLADAVAAAKKNGDMDTASMTVEAWFTYWLDHVAFHDTRPATMRNYRSFAKVHIIPAIGKVRLDKLTTARVRRVVENMVDKNGQPLSATTRATALRIMRSAFAAAKRDGKIAVNPAQAAKAPPIPAPDLEVLTVDEVAAFVRTYRNSPELYLWLAFMLTGARRGEILGLEWDRVTDALDLSWQLQRHSVEMVAAADYEYRRLNGGLYLTRPKSKAGWRVVPLVNPLRAILEQWRSVAPPNPYNLVFVTADGEPIDPGVASKKWPAVLKAAGITKRVRLHDLRHSAVDLLYEAGVHETVITEIVGHSSRSMTRAYKSRGNRPQLTDAMTSVSRLLGISE